MDVAYCLINSLKNVSACPSSYPSANEDENSPTVNNLVVFPWCGLTNDGLTLCNTCPLDNWIMIFQVLVKSKIVNLTLLSETGHKIGNVLNLTLEKYKQIIS